MAASDKHKAFVSEYLIDRNAKQAAIRAGYSEKTAEQQGSRLLSNAKVQKAIAAGEERTRKRNELTEDRIIQELMLLGFANMADYMKPGADGVPYVDFKDLTREQAAALQEVTVDTHVDGTGEDARVVTRIKFKLHDKRATLVDLGKHIGMFKDRKVLEFDEEHPLRAIVRAVTEQPLLPSEQHRPK